MGCRRRADRADDGFSSSPWRAICPSPDLHVPAFGSRYLSATDTHVQRRRPALRISQPHAAHDDCRRFSLSTAPPSGSKPVGGCGLSKGWAYNIAQIDPATGTCPITSDGARGRGSIVRSSGLSLSNSCFISCNRSKIEEGASDPIRSVHRWSGRRAALRAGVGKLLVLLQQLRIDKRCHRWPVWFQLNGIRHLQRNSVQYLSIWEANIQNHNFLSARGATRRHQDQHTLYAEHDRICA